MLSADDIVSSRVGTLDSCRPGVRPFWLKSLVFFSIGLLTLDTAYKTYFDISYQTREKCLLFTSLPKWAFLFYEYFVELLLVVIVGIFAAALLEKYFGRLKALVPKHSLSAFLYASVVPVCSCSAIPLVRALDGKIRFRVIITFIVAAPLLNPYIVMVSLTVLGLQYALLRIACALVLAVTTGYIAELVYNRIQQREIGGVGGCGSHGTCPVRTRNVYEATFSTFRQVLPFMLVAGLLSVAVELAGPGGYLKSLNLDSGFVGTLLVILVGVPVYFCNGADVLFLHPLVHGGGLPLGTAMAFSMTSTSVCITSLAMLIKFVGRKLTAVILACIVLMTVLLSLVINVIPFR